MQNSSWWSALKGQTTKSLALQLKETGKEKIEDLVDECLHRVSASEPGWALLGGQLLMLDLAASNPHTDFCLFVREKVREGQYTELFDLFTDAELQQAASWADDSRDLLYTLSGARLFRDRYLGKGEKPQWLYLCAALLLSINEKNRLEKARDFYDELSLLRLSLATPLLLGLRNKGANLSSCFIASADDSLESLISLWGEVAKISKSGGGVGVCLSRVRANGSWVAGRANSAGGVTGWALILNNIAVVVNQGGKRAGAVTVALDMWHLDIPEFLELQTENGDQRKKAYDIFPQVVIPDEFMRRVKSNGTWTLVDPYEVNKKLGIDLANLVGTEFEAAYAVVESADLKLKQVWSARELYTRVLRTLVETGMPYQAFKDTINAANPNSHDGIIPSVNLCVESYSNVKPHSHIHVCNLMSINLARATEQTLPITTRRAVRMLDNAIELTEPPVAGAASHNQRYRTIGLGMMGLADWLAWKEIMYTQAVSEASRVAEIIAEAAFRENALLGRERGSFGAFAGSRLQQGILFGRLFNGKESLEYRAAEKTFGPLAKEALGCAQARKELFSKAKQAGLKITFSQLDWDPVIQETKAASRCSQLLAIAPNTSSSLLQGCTASVLPTHSRVFFDQNAKGATPVVAPFLAERFWYYHENKHTEQDAVIAVTAALQQWVDTGISMELLFDLNKEQMRQAPYLLQKMMTAWESGVKAIYYLRWVQKDSTREAANCSTCAN